LLLFFFFSFFFFSFAALRKLTSLNQTDPSVVAPPTMQPPPVPVPAPMAVPAAAAANVPAETLALVVQLQENPATLQFLKQVMNLPAPEPLLKKQATGGGPRAVEPAADKPDAAADLPTLDNRQSSEVLRVLMQVSRDPAIVAGWMADLFHRADGATGRARTTADKSSIRSALSKIKAAIQKQVGRDK
jgi:hypothetical protein